MTDRYILECKAKTTTVAYDRLKNDSGQGSHGAGHHRVLRRQRHADQNLYYKETKDFGDGLRRPSVLETDSPLYKGYKSVMLYAKISKKVLADEVFSLNTCRGSMNCDEKRCPTETGPVRHHRKDLVDGRTMVCVFGQQRACRAI